jgi:hypothetical protein
MDGAYGASAVKLSVALLVERLQGAKPVERGGMKVRLRGEFLPEHVDRGWSVALAPAGLHDEAEVGVEVGHRATRHRLT